MPRGISIELAVGIIFLLQTNYRNPYFYSVDQNKGSDFIRIQLAQEVSFLNKGTIQYTLTHIARDKPVIIDRKNVLFIDKAVQATIFDFHGHTHTKNI
nr:hypothetical protein [uncultured Pedobacter sp.]